MVELAQILSMLAELAEDRRVPRNVRTALSNVVIELQRPDENIAVKVSTAISTLDDVSNDPNIKPFTRTEVWSIVSMLESFQSEQAQLA